MSEDSVRIIDDNIDEPFGGSRPPGWMIVIVVVVLFGVALLFASRASTSVDSAADPPPTSSLEEQAIPVPSDPPPTSTLEEQVTPVPSDPPPTPIFEEQVISVSATPSDLRGHVAVTSPDQGFFGSNFWMFRPGGSLVTRTDLPVGDMPDPYPIVMTGESIMFSGVSGWLFDIDLLEAPVLFETNRAVIPGAEPGLVWFARRSGLQGDYLWVSPVDVESRTVGERIDITGVFTRPVAGIAEGLIVVPVDQEKYGGYAYWSPTDGLMPIGLRQPETETVVTASGSLAVVASHGRASIFDIASGDYISSFAFDFGDTVTSACLSPDNGHVVIVGSNGETVIGETATGAVVPLPEERYGYGPDLVAAQLTHGIGWATNQQAVVIGVGEDSSHLFGFDIGTSEGFHIADMEGHGEWWLAAGDAMC